MGLRAMNPVIVLTLCIMMTACNTATGPGNRQADAGVPANAAATGAPHAMVSTMPHEKSAAGVVVVHSDGPISTQIKAGQTIDQTTIVLGKGDSIDVIVNGQTQHFTGPGRFVPGQVVAQPTALTQLLEEAGKPHAVVASTRREVRPGATPKLPETAPPSPSPPSPAAPAPVIMTRGPVIEMPLEVKNPAVLAAPVGRPARRVVTPVEAQPAARVAQ
jgi:predicted small secreted protein